MTTQELQAELDRLDDGVLRHGSHTPGREFCALEFESQVRGRTWSDAPLTLPDLRPINDGPWSTDAVRTAALLPVMSALWAWADWSAARRQRWTEIVAIETVKQIIAELPSLPKDVQKQCQTVVTLQDAEKAAEAAWATWAARAAAWAAAEAARAAAARAAANAVLQRACTIWINAAAHTEEL